MPSRAANVLLAIVSGLVAIAIIEISLHVLVNSGELPASFKHLERLKPVFDKYSGFGLYYSHPYISYDVRPGYQNDLVKINSSGFRGDQMDIPKPASRLRIFALGASTTYGIFNEQDETWPYRLEKQLRSKYPRSDLEVVNAGLVSATTAESLIRLLLKIMPLEPDILLVYHGYNDLAPRMFNGFEGDYYHFRRTPFSEKSALSGFYTVKIITDALLPSDVHLENANLLDYTWRMDNMPSAERDKISNFHHSDSSVFERNLDYIISVAISRNVPVVLATFAFDDTKRNWNSLMPDQLWGLGIEQNNRSVRALAARHRVPLCLFAEQTAGDHALFDDSIHLTMQGNVALAKCFVAALESRREVKSLLERRGSDSGTGE